MILIISKSLKLLFKLTAVIIVLIQTIGINFTCYADSAKIWQLDKFLFNQGFVRTDTYSGTQEWGTALYVKRKIIHSAMQQK
ncbi:MAG: hypothetical protein HRU35_06260 [Rickettsiaceae bacterium]|nr:hypothetical protein [Rickettsiaceae bacterium]